MNDRIEYRPMQHPEEPEEPPRIVPPGVLYAATGIVSALSASLLTWSLSPAAPVRVETREVPVVREVVKEVPVVKEVVREVPKEVVKEVPVVRMVKEYVPLPTTDKLVERTFEKCVPVQTNVVRQVAAPKPKPKPRPTQDIDRMFADDPRYLYQPVYRY